MASLPYFFLLSSLLLSFASLSLSSNDFEKELQDSLTARRPPPPPAPISPPPPPPCDYYLLALQWPVSFCNDISDPNRCDRTGKPRDLPLYFTIHGLWPQKNSGEKLEKCTKEGFAPNEISGLTDKLKKFMPTLKKYNDPLFTSQCLKHWQHEWEVHGTCSGLSQKSYFEMALNVMNKIDILNGLPTKFNPGSRINPRTMASEIASVYHPATITCNTGRTNVEQLYEVRFSVNLAGDLQPISNPRVSCSALLPSAPTITSEFGFSNYSATDESMIAQTE